MNSRSRNIIKGYVFISPWLIGFLLFTLIPFVVSLYLSFTDYDVFNSPKWVGLDNYEYAFNGDPDFWKSVYNTLYYVIFFVPLSIIAGFFLAVLLNSEVKFMTVYRTAFYLPSIVPNVAAVILWIFMFDPKLGLINGMLGWFGVDQIGWLSDPAYSKPAIIIMGLWGVGGGMIIFLAGLQGISRELYESAEIDGAGPWIKLVRITVPMMTPTILFNLIMGIIGSFQVFNVAYLASAGGGTGVGNLGGPLKSYLFYILKLYVEAFQYFNMGYAAALAWLLFIVIFIITLIVFKTSKNWVHYN